MKLTPLYIDFETFWSTTHSLSKMNPIAYVMHPDTELISLAYKFDNDETHVIFGEQNIKNWCASVDWSDKLAIAHNMSGFDAMVLAWRCGVKPKMWGCTLAMAKPHHGFTVGGSLAALMKYYNLGIKDTSALLNTKGRHFVDFTPSEIAAMRTYNKHDTEACAELFKLLLPITPKREMKLIDMTIRMLVEPKFEVDKELLLTTLGQEKMRKTATLLSLADRLGWEPSPFPDDEHPDAEEYVRLTLASAPKFAKFLEELNVPVPMKQSPTNPENMIPALAKSDSEFIELTTHPNTLVAEAARARLDIKSTILETRIESFLEVSDCMKGKMPIAKNYYGGHTGRWSGAMALNQENLPRIDKKKPKPSDALRNSLVAPKGYKVVVADLSGIELRVNHFLWQVPSSTAMFQIDPEKADLYTDFASTFYEIPVDQVSHKQRQIGKVCLSEGTLLLCKHANRVLWVPIEKFNPEYQLWDGKEWVWAKGVVSNGWKQTQQLCGVSLTPDHLVLCGTTWQEARYVTGEKIAQALESGAENLPLRAMSSAFGPASLGLWLSATAGFLSTYLKQATSKLSNQLGATLAPRKQQVGNATGNTSKPCRKMNIGLGFLTDFLRPLHGAITRGIKATKTTVGGASQFVMSGAKTGLSSFGTSGLCPDGTTLYSKWTASTQILVTATGTSDLYPEAKTRLTSDKSLSCSGESKLLSKKSHVYDILECGPRNRFTVLSNKGPLVVHNCHLGLGFGAGATTFQTVAKNMAGVDLSLKESQEAVNAWRDSYPQIVQGWKRCHKALDEIYQGALFGCLDEWGLCRITSEGIETPRGSIRYPKLHKEKSQALTATNLYSEEWWYGEGRNRARIYAGKVTENVVQHLARNVLADNMLAIQKRYPIVHCVHDEIILIVPENEAEEALKFMQEIMRTPPTWWPELVVWSEGGISDTYGGAK